MKSQINSNYIKAHAKPKVISEINTNVNHSSQVNQDTFQLGFSGTFKSIENFSPILEESDPIQPDLGKPGSKVLKSV